VLIVLLFRMGQTHVHRDLRPLLERIRARAIDPSFIVSHRLPLSRAPAYRMWNDKTDDCTKIVLNPAP
jgi:threonine dehydrogenase-like Zn-dependent dehydrogenase